MEKNCKICDTFEGHYYYDHMDGKGIEFYEFMHGDFKQHVSIPKKLANYFRGKLPETVDLKGPSGKIWTVGLKETSDGLILLQSGWKEFAEAHHILESYFVVFKYDGKSCFDISIYDENRCKREACYLFMETNIYNETERSENPVEILDVKSCQKAVMCRSSGIPCDDLLHGSPSSAARKISRENETAASKYQRAGSSYKWNMSNEHSHDPMNKRCRCCPDSGARSKMYNAQPESVNNRNFKKFISPNVCVSGRNNLTSEQEERVSYLVHSVQPDNPCFVSFLQPSSVGSPHWVYAPAEFWIAHFASKSCAIYLQVRGRSKRWCIHVGVSGKVVRICWKSFAIDNSLQAGDACLFELVDDPTDVVLDVSILRAAGHDD